MSQSRKDVDLIDITTPSVAYDPKADAICHAWDRQAREVIDAIDECVILPNLHKIVNSDLIDLLAWQLHVDFYEPDMPLELRRTLVRKSLEWHIYKGTKWAVEEILQTVFKEGRVIEWFEYNPKPHADWHDAYRFKVLTGTSSSDPMVLRRVVAAINSMKPRSRWMESFVIAKPTAMELYEASITVKRIRTTVYLMDRPTLSTDENIFVGVAIRHLRTITIFAPSLIE